MNTTRSPHPLLLVATVAVVAVVMFCTFGIAAILGSLAARDTSITAPAYRVGDSGTSDSNAAAASPGGNSASGVATGVSSYGASGGSARLKATTQASDGRGPSPAHGAPRKPAR